MPLVRNTIVNCSCSGAKNAHDYKVCLLGCQALKQLGDSVNNSTVDISERLSTVLVSRDLIVAAMRANLREWSADFPSFVRRATMNVEWY